MKHSHVENRNGSKPIAVSVNGDPLGVLLPDGARFKFLAVRLSAFGIDGQVFDSVEAAQAAATAAVRRADVT